MRPSCMTRCVPWRLVFPFLSFVFTLNCLVSNAQASQVNEKARDSYMAAMDIYYKANQQADYGAPLYFVSFRITTKVGSLTRSYSCLFGMPHCFSVLTSALICKTDTHKKSLEQWDHMYTIPQ